MYNTKQGVILAAGLGTRLRPLTENIPKAMVPIQGKPLILHHIEQMKKYGIREFFINLHHLPEKITDYFGDGSAFGVKIFYSHEKELLGTGGALSAFKPALGERFVLAYGDIFTSLDYQKFMDFDEIKGGAGSIVLKKTDHPDDSDLVTLNNNGGINKFFLKPHKNSLPQESFGMSGIYILSGAILNTIPLNVYCELDHQILPEAVKNNMSIYGYETTELVEDVGTIDRYERIVKRFQ